MEKGMQVSKLPLWKVIDQPFFSLDGSHVELFALIFLFMATVVVMSVHRRRHTRHRHGPDDRSHGHAGLHRQLHYG